jgi:hypothetical protein
MSAATGDAVKSAGKSGTKQPMRMCWLSPDALNSIAI